MSMQLNINHITFFAESKLNILSDICAICRENVLTNCIKCSQVSINNMTQVDECISVIGICEHVYHKCCITSWTSNLSSIAKKCPLCNKLWELKKRSINISNTNQVVINPIQILNNDLDINY